MASVDLIVGGTHCSSCSLLIEMSLSDLPGVSSANADYVKGTAHVEYDPVVVSEHDIAAAVVAAGYTAEISQ